MTEPPLTPKPPRRFEPSLIAKGFLMGAADVVPGVSGGTMAFILGIYSRLIDAVRSFGLEAAQTALSGKLLAALRIPHWLFVIPLGIGIVLALLFFTRVVGLPELLETHPQPVYGLFFGLILGSVAVLLAGRAVRHWGDLLWIALGTGLGLAAVNLVPVATPDSWWMLMLSGALAISAMLVPGISGSFILLILGKYSTIYGAIGRFDFGVLLPFMLGCVCGLIGFSRLLSWLLHRFEHRMILTISGLLLGTLWAIWPFREPRLAEIGGETVEIGVRPVWPSTLSGEGWLALGLGLLGLLAVLLIDRLAGRQEQHGRA